MSTQQTPERYRGRFAPSPTGPLHFGSLVAAVGSFLQARAAGGEWLVRMEDLDPPREQEGAADAILRTLEAFGLFWDGTVLYQSARAEAYDAALERLRRDGLLYPCGCSRKEVEQVARERGLAPGVYPGICRTGPSRRRPVPALRLLTEGDAGFRDAVQGAFRQDLAREVGDFVLRRADGLYAYQLAVVVDDAEQGITDVVRGSDLLDSTPRQLYLQRLLDVAAPRYLHLPVAVDTEGRKLSKQGEAPPVDPADPVPALWHALAFLGQAPPPDLRAANLDGLWEWALGHWRPDRIPAHRTRPAPTVQGGRRSG